MPQRLPETNHDRAVAGLDDLAIFGGRPEFASPLHVGRPNIPDRGSLLARIDGALERQWLTNDGPLVKEFEDRVAEQTGTDHCVAVSSATIGIQLVAQALGLSGEVILPSFTFIGTAHALRWIGLEPVFCDIDRQTHNLDPQQVAAAVGDRTAAILGVHIWGRPCAIEPLQQIADRHGLPLLFDAAHAIGCSHHGRPLGSFGTAEVFSFHATKVVGAAEGGAITTNDSGLAERLRLMRNFGFVEYDTVAELGTNAKMSELNAAMGLTSLDSYELFVETNRRNYECYASELEGLANIQLIDMADGEQHNFHYPLIEVPAELRDDLVAVLHAENVLARRYFHPGCHRSAPYRELPGTVSLPATEQLSARVINLPTGQSIDPDDIARVCSIIRLALERAPELQSRLRRDSTSG